MALNIIQLVLSRKQWGFNTVNNNAYIYFPVSFSRNAFAVTGSHDGGGGAIFVAINSSLSIHGFTAGMSNNFGGLGNTALSFYWFAIGC